VGKWSASILRHRFVAPLRKAFANTDIDIADVSIVNPDGTTSVVHTTQNHPFWNATTHTWSPAADLRPGDQLLTLTRGVSRRRRDPGRRLVGRPLRRNGARLVGTRRVSRPVRNVDCPGADVAPASCPPESSTTSPGNDRQRGLSRSFM
jgi:hypothetical protein